MCDWALRNTRNVKNTEQSLRSFKYGTRSEGDGESEENGAHTEQKNEKRRYFRVSI